MESNASDVYTIIMEHYLPKNKIPYFKDIRNRVRANVKQAKGFIDFKTQYLDLDDETIVIVTIKFDNQTNFDIWSASDERKKTVKELVELNKRDVEPSYHVLSSFESLYSLKTSGPILPPPLYKTAILVWLSVFPTLYLVFLCFGFFLDDLNLALRVLIASFITINLVTFVITPRLARLFRWWLYPNKT